MIRRSSIAVRSQANLHFDKINVEQRQQAINDSYKTLCSLSQVHIVIHILMSVRCLQYSQLQIIVYFVKLYKKIDKFVVSVINSFCNGYIMLCLFINTNK